MRYDWRKIGERIRAERKASKLTMEELADEIYTTRQTISKWENGTGVEITLNMLLELCRVFDCELGYLLCEYDTKRRTTINISKETGLSKMAVEHLQTLTTRIYQMYDDEDCDTSILNAYRSVLEFIDTVLSSTAKSNECFTALVNLADQFHRYLFKAVTADIQFFEDDTNLDRAKSDVKVALFYLTNFWTTFAEYEAKYYSTDGDFILLRELKNELRCPVPEKEKQNKD